MRGELGDMSILGQPAFERQLRLEEKRTERSNRRFALLLLEMESLVRAPGRWAAWPTFLRTFSASTRETDVTGWYKEDAILGVLFTEIGVLDGEAVSRALLAKAAAALEAAFGAEETGDVRLTCRIYPDGSSNAGGVPGREASARQTSTADKRLASGALAAKRAIDVAAAAFGLILLSPLLALIALIIKATSRGPVLFRQTRVGHHGKPFTFLKFRSMYVRNDPTVHQEYMKRFIAGDAERAGSDETPYKLTGDSRVTPIGKFLRRGSLDELPQLINVVKGDMSLVGPRPAIPYEVECYELWHRRRLAAAKPGITGMWQVEARSRVPFDEMVRLDLKYARTWSLWLDFKILLRTPRAVFTRSGAY